MDPAYESYGVYKLKTACRYPTRAPSRAPTKTPTRAPVAPPVTLSHFGVGPPTRSEPGEIATVPPTLAPTKAPSSSPTKAPSAPCPASGTRFTFELWDGTTDARVSTIRSNRRYCFKGNWNIRAVDPVESASCDWVRMSLFDGSKPIVRATVPIRRVQDRTPLLSVR
jgi:hypothetical protein